MKKAKQPVTYEEFLAHERSQFETHHRGEEKNIPEPTYKFTVGEEVSFGGYGVSRVEGVDEGGKRVYLSYQDTGTSYGHPYDNGRKPRLVWWTEVDPIALETETAFARPRIHTEFRQTSLDSLIHTAYHRGVIDTPDYQRDYVWSLSDKQRLIRSVFNRVDIGKFLFLEDDTYKEYRVEVVDGKQRLRAILDYYEGRFAYEGKTWFQLSRQDKRMFTDLMVQFAMLQRSFVKKSDVLYLFLQLNVGGVPQTEEHIAHARKLYEEALKAEEK